MPQVMITLEFVALSIQLNHLANPEQSSSMIAGLIFAGIPLILGAGELLKSLLKTKKFTGVKDFHKILTGIGAFGVGAGIYSLQHGG
jgi:hypothetical protein